MNVLPGRPLVAAVVGLLVVAGLGTAGPVLAEDGGNSANAQACQKGGWRELRGSDGTRFASQGECVSFGAHGGVIRPETLQDRWEDVCADGGWIVTTTSPEIQWHCNMPSIGPPITEDAKRAMEEICLEQGWTPFANSTDGGYDFLACNNF